MHDTAPLRLDDELVTLDELAAAAACSKRHITRLVERGELPPPVRLGALVRWKRSTISEWLAHDCKHQEGAA